MALGPSPIARAIVAALAISTAGIAVQLPLAGWALALSLAALAGWAAICWQSFGSRSRGRRAVELVLCGDRTIVVRDAARQLRSGIVCTETYVTPSLTAIVWKPNDAILSRSILILPDMLSEDDFRRLRVLLRYGRRDETAGVPASQA